MRDSSDSLWAVEKFVRSEAKQVGVFTYHSPDKGFETWHTPLFSLSYIMRKIWVRWHQLFKEQKFVEGTILKDFFWSSVLLQHVELGGDYNDILAVRIGSAHDKNYHRCWTVLLCDEDAELINDTQVQLEAKTHVILPRYR